MIMWTPFCVLQSIIRAGSYSCLSKRYVVLRCLRMHLFIALVLASVMRGGKYVTISRPWVVVTRVIEWSSPDATLYSAIARSPLSPHPPNPKPRIRINTNHAIKSQQFPILSSSHALVTILSAST